MLLSATCVPSFVTKLLSESGFVLATVLGIVLVPSPLNVGQRKEGHVHFIVTWHRKVWQLMLTLVMGVFKEVYGIDVHTPQRSWKGGHIHTNTHLCGRDRLCFHNSLNLYGLKREKLLTLCFTVSFYVTHPPHRLKWPWFCCIVGAWLRSIYSGKTRVQCPQHNEVLKHIWIKLF